MNPKTKEELRKYDKKKLVSGAYFNVKHGKGWKVEVKPGVYEDNDLVTVVDGITREHVECERNPYGRLIHLVGFPDIAFSASNPREEISR